jgi:hypothetical protein
MRTLLIAGTVAPLMGRRQVITHRCGGQRLGIERFPGFLLREAQRHRPASLARRRARPDRRSHRSEPLSASALELETERGQGRRPAAAPPPGGGARKSHAGPLSEAGTGVYRLLRGSALAAAADGIAACACLNISQQGTASER